MPTCNVSSPASAFLTDWSADDLTLEMRSGQRFTVVRNGPVYRVNKDGVLEEIPANRIAFNYVEVP